MKAIKTVSLIGLGSIGAFFAPRLEEALGKGNFRIIAGGARRERLEREGTRINGVTYRFPVVDPSEESEPADLVLIAVKAYHLEEAIGQIASQVGPDTVIMSLLNGVDSERQVGEVYGMERMLYSLMRVSVAMKDHSCDYDPAKGLLVFGEADNKICSDRVLAVKALMDRAGIPSKIPEDMIYALWVKFLANVSENMTSTLLGLDYGAFQQSEGANLIRHRAMEEVVAIASRMGIALGQREIEKQDAVIKTFPPQNKSSTLQDLEAGRRTEADIFSGAVIRMGGEFGIPTPVNEILYHAVKVLEQKNITKTD